MGILRAGQHSIANGAGAMRFLCTCKQPDFPRSEQSPEDKSGYGKVMAQQAPFEYPHGNKTSFAGCHGREDIHETI
jgi:hypothetical protein